MKAAGTSVTEVTPFSSMRLTLSAMRSLMSAHASAPTSAAASSTACRSSGERLSSSAWLMWIMLVPMVKPTWWKWSMYSWNFAESPADSNPPSRHGAALVATGRKAPV